ncbi:MAG: hypothetical protein DSY83_01540 [Flavobacteriia bacterium]|nr:MAG: hypothetical protein DSY83_01540 [Flavobacteriia bacterium]
MVPRHLKLHPMALQFLGNKTQRFYFQDQGERKSYVLIYGDEVESLQGNAPTAGYTRINYRGRDGEIKNPSLVNKRSLEMYFLDVGQGDAAFVVTPNDTKILVDGGLRDRALGFIIWKYRLDIPGNTVTIDHMFLSHADADHVEGLIPLIEHPQITVNNIYHNGIGLFDSGFNTDLGNEVNGELVTKHSTLADLNGFDLKGTFKKWVDAIKAKGINYHRLDKSAGILNIGDPDIRVEILGPILKPNGAFEWFGGKSHTINGHSLVFRMSYDHVRTFFSGDLNIEGSGLLLSQPDGALNVNAHVFKAPHHGSHEFDPDLFKAVNPMVTVVSSGEVPDHGHPRAKFLGAIGRAVRGEEPLLFSTALSALFVDDEDAEHVAASNIIEPTTLGDLDFSLSASNTVARRRFKKILPGIINVRTDGEYIYAYRRVQMGYQWESYKMRYEN